MRADVVGWLQGHPILFLALTAGAVGVWALEVWFVLSRINKAEKTHNGNNSSKEV